MAQQEVNLTQLWEILKEITESINELKNSNKNLDARITNSTKELKESNQYLDAKIS